MGMPSSEMNEDVKKDLKLLTMRNLFNPKRHYKVILMFWCFGN